MKTDQMPLMRPVPMNYKEGEVRKWRIEENPYWFWTDPKDPYVSYGVPKGFIFDGSSITQIFWDVLSPTGYLFIPGLLHDFSYRYGKIITRGLYTKDSGIQSFTEPYTELVTKNQADDIFKYIANSIRPDNDGWIAIADLALGVGGHSTWNNHRENNLQYSIGDVI
jgi:hypothetical protein